MSSKKKGSEGSKRKKNDSGKENGPPVLQAKKKCCESDPRCAKCPFVLERLADRGFLSKEGKRSFVLVTRPDRKDWKQARKT